MPEEPKTKLCAKNSGNLFSGLIPLRANPSAVAATTSSDPMMRGFRFAIRLLIAAAFNWNPG
jgi:hypothetical protein